MPNRLLGLAVTYSILVVLSYLPQSTLAQDALSASPSALGGPPLTGVSSDGKNAGNDILNLDIEQLAKTPVVVPSMDIPVTSVTKEPSTIGHSAAAVFVITQEMIRRSGATCVPEALRMAPGVDVAQINSNTWAISIRGFTFGPYSNKLLVMIDGRTIYNPNFAGVVWHAEDVLLEDVDRIEVIRGPGGTLWGANAVNGVINVITKVAKDTQGVYAMAGGGTYEKSMDAFRYGNKIGDSAQYRVYGKYIDQGANFNPDGMAADAWRQGRAGFRADWQPDLDKSNTFTILGDHYVGSTDNSIIPTSPFLSDYLTGDDLQLRWQHTCDEDSNWMLQMYYESYMRRDSLQTEINKTFDVEFQYCFRLDDRNKITCGAEFRNVESAFTGGDTFTPWFSTPNWTTNYPSQFVQDEIGLVDERLVLTLGCKLEENPYTATEYQPTIRLLWAPDNRHSCWGAISRAVHTPTRVEEQVSFTTMQYAPDVYTRAIGNPALSSEAMYAYELGYREQATDQFSWDVATFYNVYDGVITPNGIGAPFIEMDPLPPHAVIPLTYLNSVSGRTYGVELSSKYEVTKSWRLSGNYAVFQMSLDPPNVGDNYQGWDPRNQVYLRSSWDLSEHVDFDMMTRYVDALLGDGIPSYISLDLRLAWRPQKHLEFAVVGQNLLQDHHAEFGSLLLAYKAEVPRSVYGTMTWRY